MKHINAKTSSEHSKQRVTRPSSKPLVDNRTVQQQALQLAGDRYYWVKPANGSWQYVGAFKNHAQANNWWAANKGNYPGGRFGQGSSKTKYR
ncbi:hypothetical protein HG263_06955 [Pseudoalteromonas sp. JBTF-M23]|uniref:Uncharacterized protein n=1 Tax=Pseudoalteromonas caenipelagi TaxID=2726988 RepID=A0A849V9K1_9GAMM|nr:hypothetical protein [Pseudoalteromonas caenipelagi]NOU50279.1 hypothetical protein [Pseudoalteromonas caenipelagi]